MATNCYLSVDDKGKLVDQTEYKGIIGSLLYLNASRPDFMFSVCMCVHYQSCPKKSHFSAVKRFTMYPKGVEISLVEYSDSNFVGCKLDRKSTSDTCHLLGNGLVSWNNKKKAYVALSMAEVEYIVARSCCA